MRKAAMKQRLESGNLTLEGKKQRDEKLADKNKVMIIFKIAKTNENDYNTEIHQSV